jgi:hypothetical protein
MKIAAILVVFTLGSLGATVVIPEAEAGVAGIVLGTVCSNEPPMPPTNCGLGACTDPVDVACDSDAPFNCDIWVDGQCLLG